MSVVLDTRSLERAIASLVAGLTQHALAPDDDLLRDGCIQRFEFTYEVSHKMLRRFLEATSADPDSVAALSFPDLIRTGSERGLLLSGWPRWKDFRRARSLTSHAYDEAKAREVFADIPGSSMRLCASTPGCKRNWRHEAGIERRATQDRQGRAGSVSA